MEAGAGEECGWLCFRGEESRTFLRYQRSAWQFLTQSAGNK